MIQMKQKHIFVEHVFYYYATLCISAVFAVAQCLSVTLVHCIQTAENIVPLFISPVAPSF